MVTEPVLVIWLALVVLTAGYYDIRYRRVPNWLVLLGLVFGFAFNAFYGGAEGAWLSVTGFAVGFGVYFVLYLLRGMGAGDVKLMGAVGATVGPANWFGIFVITGILGGVVAMVLLLAKGRLRQSLSNVGYILNSLAARQKPFEGRPDLDVRTAEGIRLPHAAVIMLGSLIFLTVTTFRARG